MTTIPLFTVDNLSDFCRDEQERAHRIIRASRNTYGKVSDIAAHGALPASDWMVKKWLARRDNPYRQEIDSYAKHLNTAGVYALNLSYEWGCTSGAYATKGAPDLLRVLDWPFPGLGEEVCVVQQQSHAGQFYNITWPAVSGMFQGMAPGRFAAAINQAPMRRHGLTIAGDWLKNRYLMFRQTSLPPAHLLRKVFEEAKTYDEAKVMLIQTPICIPVIFTLSGINDGESCVIERLEDQAVIREADHHRGHVATSNHFHGAFNGMGKGWLPRAVASGQRVLNADALADSISYDHFGWLNFPIINHLTRLVMLTNAASGQLIVQGWQPNGPATHQFTLSS